MSNQLRFDSKQKQTLDLEGRVPPQNLEAERSLLGCILLMSESLDEVGEIIHADHFYSDAHQKIFRAAQELYEKGARGIDAVTVAEVLANKSQLEDVGGTPYLVDLMEAVPHAAHARYYANIVREKWLQRNLIYSCTEVLKECYDSSIPVADLLGRAEASIFRIVESHNMTEDIDLRDILLSAWDRVNDRMLQSGKITGLQTGFYDFDVKTSGLQAQELVILAARPSMGKTALVCNMAEGIARLNQKVDEDGKPAGGRRGVLMFSLEQSNLELAERLMCIRSKVDAGLVRSGEIRQDQESQDKLLKAINELNEMPIFIDDQPGRNMMQIATIARRLKRRLPDTHKCELGVIIIDYLQLVEPEDKRAPREQQISAISRRLKFMAKELDVPVIALSQLNRGVELREDKRPRLSDLRESGAIEQDADLIAFLHRPEQYDPEDRPGEADLIVAKHRSGPTGVVTLTYRKQYMRFEDFVNRDIDEAAFGHPQTNFTPPPEMDPPPNLDDPGLNTRF